MTLYQQAAASDPKQGRVLLLHGAGMDHRAWADLAPRLAALGYDVLMPDCPPMDNIPALAEWAAALWPDADDLPLHLVGHSMGALVALALAARRGCASLTLMGIAYPMTVHADFLALAMADDPKAYALMNKWSFAAPPDTLHPLIAAMANGPKGALGLGLRACNAYDAGFEDAARVNCSALFILGARDKMTPPGGADDLMARMPRARRIVIDKCGHMMLADAFEETLAALVAHMAAHK